MSRKKISPCEVSQVFTENVKDDIFLVFPQLVWELIFQQIEDPQDWLNLYRASSQFKGFMDKHETVALLSEVFRHVAWKLDMNEILNCRLVCKQFKTSVDNVNINNMKEVSILAHPLEYKMYIYFSRVFTGGVETDQFLTAMNSHPGCPFVGGELRIEVEKNFQELGRANWRKLLEKFGKHVQVFLLIFEPGHEDLTALIYKLLEQDFLPQMPNLKILGVDFEDGCEDFDDEDISHDIPQVSLPKLKNLKCVEYPFHNGWRLEFEPLLNTLPFPEKVTKAWLRVLPVNFAQRFQNVQDIRLELNSKEDINTIRESNWLLKSLGLYGLCVFREKCDDEDLCSMINQFGKTLRKLELDDVSNSWVEEESKLTLPKLRSLSLEILQLKDYTKLFSGLIFLEELSISKFWRELETTKKLMRNEKIHKSSIWRVLPKLKVLVYLGERFVRKLQ